MRILQFGFADRDAHNYLPHRYVPNTVVYTGTHDNNTTRGWWDQEATKAEKDAVKTYLGTSKKDVVWAMIRAAETSVADTCILPVQNLLELGEEATHEYAVQHRRQLELALPRRRSHTGDRREARRHHRSGRPRSSAANRSAAHHDRAGGGKNLIPPSRRALYLLTAPR